MVTVSNGLLVALRFSLDHLNKGVGDEKGYPSGRPKRSHSGCASRVGWTLNVIVVEALFRKHFSKKDG